MIRLILSLLLFAPLLFANQTTRTSGPGIAIKDLIKLNQQHKPVSDIKLGTRIIHPELTLLGWTDNRPTIFFNTNRTNINFPKVTEQSWLTNQTISLQTKPHTFAKYEDDLFFKNPILQYELLDSHSTEIGFLNPQLQNNDSVVTHVRNLMDRNGVRYTLNFDGSELIYFDLKKTLDPFSKIYVQEQINNKAVPLFANAGKVLLSKSIKNIVMDNAINKMGILEANYITIKDNIIILETRDPGFKNVSERKQYLAQAVAAIKNRTKAQARGNLLNIEWKPRTSNKLNWH